MRRDARHRLSRWTASGLAVAGLLTAGLAGTAGAAWADGTDGPIPVAFTGPDHYDLPVDGPGQPDGEPSFEIGLKAPGDEPQGGDDGVIPVLHRGDYTVTIDASGMEGVADVRFEDEWNCDVDGLVAVCHESELYSGQWNNLRYGVTLTATADSAPGDRGTVKVTGEGDGLTFTDHTVDVLVGGPEYRMRRLREPDGFQAGDTFAAPLAFRNTGGLDGHGTVLRVLGSRGLTFPQEFSNCRYGVEDTGDLIRMRHVAVCTFDGTFEAGRAYRLTRPWKVKTADFALRDILSYHFIETTRTTADDVLEGVEDVHRGDGPELTLKEAASGGTYSPYSELDFPAHSTYDLDLTGDHVDGAKGETVTAKVTLTNHGPGWIGGLRSGGEPVGFTVDVPEGATVTDVPDGCSPKDAGHPARVAHYLCFADTPFLEKDSRTFSFGLRVDEVVEGARGRVYRPDWDDPNEGDSSNDDGWIVLNGTGDEETPGDDPAGADDGSDQDDDGSGTAGDGDQDADDTDGGLQTDGGEDGVLASTGFGALTLGGLAVLLLAGGAAVTVAVRRRGTAA